MDNERSSFINIGGEEYELILTTRATKEIAARYGGLENLGDKLLKNKNFEMALTDVYRSRYESVCGKHNEARQQNKGIQGQLPDIPRQSDQG